MEIRVGRRRRICKRKNNTVYRKICTQNRRKTPGVHKQSVHKSRDRKIVHRKVRSAKNSRSKTRIRKNSKGPQSRYANVSKKQDIHRKRTRGHVAGTAE